MKTFNQLLESLVEAWPGTKEYEAKFGKPKGMTGGDKEYRGNRHDVTVKDGVTRATRRVDSDGETKEPEKAASGEAPVKRGRGRPPGKYGSYKKKVKESLEIIESMETEEEISEFIDSLDEESYQELATFLESEQLDELSKGTMGSYISKASKSASGLATSAMHHKNSSKDWADVADSSVGPTKKNASKRSDEFAKASFDATEKQIKRQKGIDTAVKKLTKEDVEQIEELSKKTLGSYAAQSSGKAQMHATAAQDANDAETIQSHSSKAQKRLVGAAKATNRMAKEEVEQTEENIKHPNQKVLDKNKNGKLDKEDFKILRGEKKVEEQTESLVDTIAALITKQSKGEA